MGKTLFSLTFVRDLYRVSTDQGSIRTSTRSTPSIILAGLYPQRSPRRVDFVARQIRRWRLFGRQAKVDIIVLTGRPPDPARWRTSPS